MVGRPLARKGDTGLRQNGTKVPPPGLKRRCPHCCQPLSDTVLQVACAVAAAVAVILSRVWNLLLNMIWFRVGEHSDARRVARPTTCPRVHGLTGDVFDPQSHQDEPLLSYYVPSVGSSVSRLPEASLP